MHCQVGESGMTPEEALSLSPGSVPRVTLQRQRREERWRAHSPTKVSSTKEKKGRKPTFLPSTKWQTCSNRLRLPNCSLCPPKSGSTFWGTMELRLRLRARPVVEGWAGSSEVSSLHSSVDGGYPCQGYRTSEPVCKMGILRDI